MKKKLTVVIIFLIVLVFPMVSWPIVSIFDATTVEENRAKAPFPEFGDDVFVQFDDYFADRAPYRNMLIKLYNNVARHLGISYEKLLTFFNIPYYTVINNAIIGQENWLFYTGDNSIAYYKGTNLPTDEELQGYVERAEKVNEYFKALGKEFVIFIAPNKEQIYSEYMPRGIRVENEIKRADIIYSYFKEHSDVTVLYPKDELLEAKQTYVTYRKQDTHWNEFGGYIGARCLLNALQIPLGDVEISETRYLGGDLADMAVIEPLEYTSYDVSYRSEITLEYLEKSLNEYRLVSSNKNGKSLLLLGDSFRECMTEVLAKEFENSILNHRSTLTAESNYAAEFEAATTVIFQAVERYEPDIFSPYGLLQKFINMYGL